MDKDKNKDKSIKDSSNSSFSQAPVCSICGNPDVGKCWFKSADEVPQGMRNRQTKKAKE